MDINRDQLIELLRKVKSITKAATALGVNRSSVYRLCSEHRINPQEIKFDHTYFEKIDSESKAYWLGFLFADGCVYDKGSGSKSLTLKLADKDAAHIERFKADLQCSVNTHRVGGNVYVRLYSDRLCDSLIALGCTERKSLTLSYPTIPSKYNAAFIRGYFDGDGCISEHNRGSGMRLTFVGTNAFLETLQTKFEINCYATRKKLQRTGQAFVLSNSAYTQVRKILSWIYGGANVYLERKYRKAMEYLDVYCREKSSLTVDKNLENSTRLL